jgi:putative cardiolipin synthase
MQNTQDTLLGKRAKEVLNGNPNQTVASLLPKGTEAFLARIAIIEAAEKSIDVQYFHWAADLIGKSLFHYMLKAADRGVKVRILLDDHHIDSHLNTMLYSLDKHKNISIHIFNPFPTRDFHAIDFVTDFSRLNRRMHNKSFTVDNQVTIVGGRNIAEDYFSASKINAFQDIDIISMGSIVKKVSQAFDTYWNAKVVYPINIFNENKATASDLIKLRKELTLFTKKHKDSGYTSDLKKTQIYKFFSNKNPEKYSLEEYRGEVSVIYDDPKKALGKTEKEVVYFKNLLKPHIDSVSKSFEFVSPYFVPNDKEVNDLIAMVKRGVKVRVVTNSLSSTDGVMAQSGYAHHRKRLLKGGVELYEQKATTKDKVKSYNAKANSALHAKIYIFDRKEILIGSYNFDQRSRNINTEIGVIYKIEKMANSFAEAIFDGGLMEELYKVELGEQETLEWISIKEKKTHRHTYEPNTSFWRRLKQGFFSILPIESQL